MKETNHRLFAYLKKITKRCFMEEPWKQEKKQWRFPQISQWHSNEMLGWISSVETEIHGSRPWGGKKLEFLPGMRSEKNNEKAQQIYSAGSCRTSQCIELLTIMRFISSEFYMNKKLLYKQMKTCSACMLRKILNFQFKFTSWAFFLKHLFLSAMVQAAVFW